ncbi:hypothetical protein E5676_scaffold26G00010 [Cucumis melo var. makuwa]|uniref:Uncharacterized protein n=1 Tax=Cucumis melo var. makuwa TaxID=1194695 RepID=A0A5D3BCH7_CUCMM|nr:hypothetical protein E5676_scaffold26G00010 [Cucumis melo var. makuwa]
MVRIGATKCTGQRPTKGKRRRASDEGQTTMGKRRWASDDEQLTMAGVGYLCFQTTSRAPTEFLILGAFRHFLPFFSVQWIHREVSSMDGRVLKLHSVNLMTKDLSDYGKQTRIFFEVECFSPFNRDLLSNSLSVLLPQKLFF